MLHLQGVEALVLLVHGFHGLALLQGANRHEWDPLPGLGDFDGGTHPRIVVCVAGTGDN